jgi:hypothetical protein
MNMNFFIDFEATQFTQEIISIGCVAENGKSFYSEVNCKGKITQGNLLGCNNCGAEMCLSCADKTLRICPYCYSDLEFKG